MQLHNITKSFIETYLNDDQAFKALSQEDQVSVLSRLIRHVGTDLGSDALLHIGVMTDPKPVFRPPLELRAEEVITVQNLRLHGFKHTVDLKNYLTERFGNVRQHYPILLKDTQGVYRLIIIQNASGTINARLSEFRLRNITIESFYYVELLDPNKHHLEKGFRNVRYFYLTQLLEAGLKLSAESMRSFDKDTQTHLLHRFPLYIHQ